ncbi:hypothetical protein SteCoe_35681 [Stentor coeruleus]|uniref:FHA domain-containing protein n=1 Tax=Stentor coeruleus TaxID=5963 RepID=A0A1R2ARV6_9CILI|nr:hypothetical protein SteCoe_35681 [Stentor coeruleus]
MAEEKKDRIHSVFEILKLSQLDEEFLDSIDENLQRLANNLELSFIQNIDKLVLLRFSEILYPNGNEGKIMAEGLSKKDEFLDDKLMKFFSLYMNRKIIQWGTFFRDILNEINIILNIFSISLNEYVKQFIYNLIYGSNDFILERMYDDEGDFTEFFKKLLNKDTIDFLSKVSRVMNKFSKVKDIEEKNYEFTIMCKNAYNETPDRDEIFDMKEYKVQSTGIQFGDRGERIIIIGKSRMAHIILPQTDIKAESVSLVLLVGNSNIYAVDCLTKSFCMTKIEGVDYASQFKNLENYLNGDKDYVRKEFEIPEYFIPMKKGIIFNLGKTYNIEIIDTEVYNEKFKNNDEAVRCAHARLVYMPYQEPRKNVKHYQDTFKRIKIDDQSFKPNPNIEYSKGFSTTTNKEYLRLNENRNIIVGKGEDGKVPDGKGGDEVVPNISFAAEFGTIGKRHAHFVVDHDGNWHFVDMKSTNGSFKFLKNGEEHREGRISSAVPLFDIKPGMKSKTITLLVQNKYCFEITVKIN